jgi:site-specific DNA-methyltransferase (adenine-specific)
MGNSRQFDILLIDTGFTAARNWKRYFTLHLKESIKVEQLTNNITLTSEYRKQKEDHLFSCSKVPSHNGMFGTFKLDGVYLTDCVQAMKQLPSNSVDVAIADPPYNLSKGGIWKWDNSVRLPGFGGSWSKVMAEWDDMPLAEYFSFTLAWLAELKRVVRPTGSMWIHGTYHNIGIINFALQLLEIEIINEIVWYKRNSFPNLSGRRLTASHETILWAHTGSAKNRKYYFAYERSKDITCPEDCLKEQGKQMRTVWDIPNNKKPEEIQFGKHPTQKPVRLLTRMLEISAKEGDILLVPFAGAGSECIAASKLDIRFLAFENDPKFVKICEKRLESLASSMPLIQLNRNIQKKETAAKGQVYHSPRSSNTIPSLIKWTGSKRLQAGAIASLMPCYRRYFEPFLGGGAVLYLAAVPGSVASDLYEPLIRLWKMIQSEPDKVIEDYKQKWMILKRELDSIDINNKKSGDGTPTYYYTVRQRFNKEGDPLDLNFLMRTCVNGIVRFNDKREFNNSFHLSRRGMVPEQFKNIVRSWHSVIQGVDFICQDYTRTIEMAEKDDFVYLDPPYAGNQQRYIEDLDLERFFTAIDGLNRRGVKWALSFDGRRGLKAFFHTVPESLFKRKLLLSNGNSAVNKVLNGSVEKVEESLYLNY